MAQHPGQHPHQTSGIGQEHVTAREFVQRPLPSRDTWKAPTLQELRSQFEGEHDDPDRANALKDCQEDVKDYYNTLLRRWQDEMDNLLVFGGLFAAVLTPFNVESYASLRPDPTDPSFSVLQRISAQLDSFSVNSGFINSTTPSLTLADIQAPFHPSGSSVWINGLWFSSLICTLASTSIALLVKQWLHDLSAGLTGSSSKVAHQRQYRRYNALKRWHVGAIVLLPFILLQVALTLFLAGIIVLLWTLHSGIAAVSTSLVGALHFFLVIVTILPLFFNDCCYGHALAKIIYPIFGWIIRKITSLGLRFLQSRAEVPDPAGTNFDRLVFLYNVLDAVAVWSNSPTWREREEHPIAQDGDILDCATAILASTIANHDRFKDLSAVLQVKNLPTADIAPTMDKIVQARWWTDPDATELSHQQEVLVMEGRLIHALGWLLTDPQLVANDTGGERRRQRIVPDCISLLRNLKSIISEYSKRNDVLKVLSLAFGVRSSEVTGLAYDILLEVLDQQDTDSLSYFSIRYALSALEQGLVAQWGDRQTMSYNVAITHQLRAVRGVILCVLEALSPNTSLSPDEAYFVCIYASRLQLIFMGNWSTIGLPEWQRFLAPSLPRTQHDESLFQPRHSLLRDLRQYLWPLLMTLTEDPRCCVAMPQGMTETLKIAMLQAKAATGQTLNAPVHHESQSYFDHMAEWRLRMVDIGLRKSSDLRSE